MVHQMLIKSITLFDYHKLREKTFSHILNVEQLQQKL